MPPLCNLLEPQALIDHFRDEPPDGFRSRDFGSLPGFEAKFDVTTTLEDRAQRIVRRIPFMTRLARVRTAFVGTTVTEYALVPADTDPVRIARRLASAGESPFVIVKDLPVEPVLVGERSFRTSELLTAACIDAGFVRVEGQALAYVPIDFASIDELLSRFSHARRKNIRRKLRSAEALTIEDVPFGDARFDGDLVGRIHDLYAKVYAQSDIHFDFLTARFFAAVLRDPAIGGFVALYRLGDRLAGFNLCVRSDDLLIDKYIGLDYGVANDANVYTASWFHNLQRCLDLGLRCYVSGWTDPDVKRSLGARFTMTHHLVYARNPILRAALRRLRRFFEPDANWAARAASIHS